MSPAKATLSLPIINIAPWLDPNTDGKGRLSTAAALHAACLEYGFFYLDISSYIDPSEPEELARLAREFFALPQAEKEKLVMSNQDHARGALPLPRRVPSLPAPPADTDSQRRLRPSKGKRHQRTR